MCIIQTRQQKNGNWWCNGTIESYDYSYEGQTIEEAQSQMRALLEYRGINSAKWLEEQHYQVNRDMPEHLLKSQTTRLQPHKVEDLWDEAEIKLTGKYPLKDTGFVMDVINYLKQHYSLKRKL